MTDTLNPYFGKIQRDKGKVDLFQQKVLDPKIDE
jgi:hypothetical protein